MHYAKIRVNLKYRNFLWLLVLPVAGILLWFIFAPWPQWLTDIIRPKNILIGAIFNGVTLAGLYFLVASGFTLIFGLMRNINLAHGSLYLLGAYIGLFVASATGIWYLGILGGFLSMALVGVLLQFFVFRRMQNQDLRQTLVTIGISIVLADLMLAIWGGQTYQFTNAPEWVINATVLPIITAVGAEGENIFLRYPIYRLVVLGIAIVIGVLLLLFLNRTRVGLMIKAGVDDREMLAATGINIQRVFIVVFAIGAGLAGLAGVIGGTGLSIAPGNDVNYLLASLVVVIVGGVGSIRGAALGALIVGVSEQIGLTYFPTYGVLVTFLILVIALAWRPQGLLNSKVSENR